MAAATDVFVGTVVAQVGTVPLATSAPGVEIPRTQFSVKVQRKLKGRARGTVTVSQLAGIDADTRVFVAFEGDALLRPGDKVLLIAEYDPEDGWYHLIAPGFSNQKTPTKQQEDRLVGRYARAAGLPVPSPVAVETGTD